jgi:large subunit ribosomal protein L21
MYAVFEDGSRQYKVSEGQLVTVDYREAEPGTRVELNRVLLYSNGDDTRIGRPTVEGMRVLGEVVDFPSTKVYIQKFRKRKNYRRLRGHRQHYLRLRISHILLPGAETPPPPEPKKKKEEAAAEQPAAGATPAPAQQTPPTA